MTTQSLEREQNDDVRAHEQDDEPLDDDGERRRQLRRTDLGVQVARRGPGLERIAPLFFPISARRYMCH